MVKHTATSVVTIERYIIEQERLYPEATGELSGVLYDLALAAKMIANKVRSAARRAGGMSLASAPTAEAVPGPLIRTTATAALPAPVAGAKMVSVTSGARSRR